MLNISFEPTYKGTYVLSDTALVGSKHMCKKKGETHKLEKTVVLWYVCMLYMCAYI